jgi:hypothetical protein
MAKAVQRGEVWLVDLGLAPATPVGDRRQRTAKGVCLWLTQFAAKKLAVKPATFNVVSGSAGC